MVESSSVRSASGVKPAPSASISARSSASPLHRNGRGIATALMLDVIDYARSLEGLRQVQLTVTTPNPAAEQLYDRLGFVVFGLEQDALRIGSESHPKQHRQLMLSEP